jgi:DNA polymerase III epsilon subunit-like protein
MKVFLDTETTDLKTDRGGVIWQLGYIIEYDNGEILEREIKIAPSKYDLINAVTLEFCKITLEELRGFTPHEEAVKILIKDLRGQKGAMIGFNSQKFDTEYVNKFLWTAKKKYTDYFHSHSIDVLVLAANKFIDERHSLGSLSLQNICKQMGIPFDPKQAHGALYDARMTRQLYYKLKF